MSDMLVKLYELNEVESIEDFKQRTGVTIRRAMPPEKHVVTGWVSEHFGLPWVSECEVAFSRPAVNCLVAIEDNKMLGFACYDVTAKGFFGPTGVDEKEQGRGIGTMLCLYALQLMRAEGYGYAIIGGAGPTEFYAKTIGATIIEGSVPGIYNGMLNKDWD
ncbi:GNAT family N-acetyltransferase [Paenibacillus anaericanus]|uniref:GNAT family N-acetyltransferase n=1 Tax=Paenibacillus anaericanus TaxID=170367 RepID=A0A433YBC7_9BACL|nr:GNAT family N-acetyltransferase [Paenibacillus anaericanus]RUT47170.1 GNAT family N-acetyltransferase [Paenibacillus anaericanus]